MRIAAAPTAETPSTRQMPPLVETILLRHGQESCRLQHIPKQETDNPVPHVYVRERALVEFRRGLLLYSFINDGSRGRRWHKDCARAFLSYAEKLEFPYPYIIIVDGYEVAEIRDLLEQHIGPDLLAVMTIGQFDYFLECARDDRGNRHLRQYHPPRKPWKSNIAAELAP